MKTRIRIQIVRQSPSRTDIAFANVQLCDSSGLMTVRDVEKKIKKTFGSIVCSKRKTDDKGTRD